MSEERDRRVKDLFERVLDADPAEREAVLAREAAGSSIQGDVRDLLALAGGLDGFLETPASERVFGAPAPETRLAAGEVFADFTVVGPLGEGGGGVVYEAEQKEPRRRVALKVARTARRSAGAPARLRDEAANLARLQHPAIGHVYAAGVREAGGAAHPWIAMELVRGARGIVRHAREAGLSRDAKLRLMVTVCEALHHAHENGVVHRDVTPGNVLVGADGRPKVVDFGVAQSAAAAGERGAAVGTLAYASPEQLEGGATDRRADVYGLGALLHELLTGAVPIDVTGLPIAAVAEAKRTRRVPPPGARAAGVPADLGAIVLRSLAADPADRYESAAALAADLTRFLDGEPVAAHAGGSFYHLAKFVRRRRAVAAAVAGIALALAAGTAVSVSFAVDNARARDDAERRSYAAEIAAAAAALRLDDVTEARRQLERAPAHLRDFEWRHLAASLDDSAATLTFARRELWGGGASSDGRLLALCGIDRSELPGVGFAALAAADGRIVREWRAPGFSNHPATAISADGDRFAAGFADGTLLCCDLASGAERRVERAHADRIIALAFSPDGSTLATAGADGAARLWSVPGGEAVVTFAAHPDRVICVAFTPDGRRVVTGCRDGRIRVFDAASAALLRTIEGHENSVEGVDVSPDGLRVASVSRDQTVRLFDLADGAAISVGRTHASNVRGVAFAPAGDVFASASWDGTLGLWDARTGALVRRLRGHGSSVTAAAFVRGAPRLVSFSWDATVKRWDPRADAQACRSLGVTADALAVDPSGRWIAAALHDTGVALLDAATLSTAGRADDASHAVAVQFAGSGRLAVLADDGAIRVHDVGADGSLRETRRFRPSAARATAMTADLGGTTLRAAAWEPADGDLRRVREFDAATGAELSSVCVPGDVVTLAADGRGTLAVGTHEGLLSVVRGADVRTARVATASIASVAFDDDGARLVVAARDGTATVVAVADLAILHELRGHSDFLGDARFLPGGRRIVTVSRDQTARIWDASSGECLLVLRAGSYPMLSVAVTPDGRRIVAGTGAGEGPQNAVVAWDAPDAPK